MNDRPERSARPLTNPNRQPVIDGGGVLNPVRLAGLAAAGALFIATAADATGLFRRISTIPVFLNTSVETESSAEIVAAALDGTLLVYTDGPAGVLGFIDIADPAAPKATGSVELGGDPTSVNVVGDFALVAINTSRDFVNVSGRLLVIDVNTRETIRTIELGGQPDSVAVSPDGQYAAVVIENERDEDLGEGEPPQFPPGYLVIVDLIGGPASWSTRQVDLVGVPTLFPEDPEPEFADINSDNQLVLTLQENNHIALIDLPSGTVTGDFAAGSVDLEGIDAVEDDIINQVDTLRAVPREADAVTWLSSTTFATANEGDLFGGSRGFTVYSTSGEVLFDAGNTLERIVARHGHYPEARSENKGNEPEAITFAGYADDSYLFVGSERSSTIAVYTLNPICAADLDGNGSVDGADLGELLSTWGAGRNLPADLDASGAVDEVDLAALLAAWGPCSIEPQFQQLLPAGLSPEGLLAIPERNLLVVASEVDSRADLVRATVSIYQLGDEATYPLIVSADRADGSPIPWAALSGLVVDPADSETVYSVHDSFYVRSRIYTLDVSAVPATITSELELNDSGTVLSAALDALASTLPDLGSFNPDALVGADGSVNLDPEGIAVGIGGGFWIASEGAGNLANGVSNPADQPFRSPNLLLRVDATGTITDAVLPPIELTLNQFRFGYEGVAAVEENGVEVLYVAFQRRWSGAADPANRARIGRYDTLSGEWTFAYYPLEVPTSPNGGWVGLSEITALGDGKFVVIERDNQAGPDARIKRVYSFSIDGVVFAPNASAPALPLLSKSLDRDLILSGDYEADVILEKLEGLAVLPDGTTLIVNDNDGVDDSSGETRLFNLGALFAPPLR